MLSTHGECSMDLSKIIYAALKPSQVRPFKDAKKDANLEIRKLYNPKVKR
jgi:hypothetical protein